MSKASRAQKKAEKALAAFNGILAGLSEAAHLHKEHAVEKNDESYRLSQAAVVAREEADQSYDEADRLTNVATRVASLVE